MITFLQAYSGLRNQDLQEAKDQLLVETSDMLRVPLFTAEALLRNHGNNSNITCCLFMLDNLSDKHKALNFKKKIFMKFLCVILGVGFFFFFFLNFF